MSLPYVKMKTIVWSHTQTLFLNFKYLPKKTQIRMNRGFHVLRTVTEKDLIASISSMHCKPVCNVPVHPYHTLEHINSFLH